MRPVQLGEALTPGCRLTLFSYDKPDRFFTVINFWRDETSGIALALKTGVPCYQVEDEEGRIHLLRTWQSKKRMKTARASGGPIRQALILVSIFDGVGRGVEKAKPNLQGIRMQYLAFTVAREGTARSGAAHLMPRAG